MKGFFVSYKKIFVSLFLAGLFTAGAESFRVAKMHTIQLSQTYESSSTESGIFDGIAVKLPDDSTFISGIELNIKVPETIAAWRDTVAYLFYENISPNPSEQNIDYTGNRISINTIPGRLNHTIYIPLNKKFNVKNSPYAKTLEVIPQLTDNSVFLRFILAMKGAPESLESAQFEITAKPVLSDEGYFELNVTVPQDKSDSFNVYIDDKQIPDISQKILLSAGEHHLSITSDAYRNEVRTFIIEQAKSTRLNVKLRGIEPTVKIIAPENSKVYFDSQLVNSNKDEFITTTGNHTVKFVIGDYEVIKTVNAINGRSYIVNLTVDASISEEE